MKRIMGVAAGAALLLATGCSAESAAPAAPTVEPAATGSAKPADDGAQRSERGNIVKVLGQGAGQANAEGEQIADFTVNAITVDVPCTGPYPQPSENGHFIALDITAKTYPELADSQYPIWDALSPSNMKVIDSNGTTSNAVLSTGQAYSCLPEVETLDPMIGPAQNVTGKIVIDSPIPSGTLVIGQYGGWEYNF